MVEFNTMHFVGKIRSILFISAAVLLVLSCSSSAYEAELNVAAAASLHEVFQELARSFKQESGISIIPSFAATGQLAQQIRNGAPYDVFTAADSAHIDALIDENLLEHQSRTTYALGELVLVRQNGSTIELGTLQDLLQSGIDRIAIANPEHAPYGIAAREALSSADLWETVESKIIYAETVKQAAVIVSTGNADVGIIASSVLDPTLEMVASIPPELYEPILHVAAMSMTTERTNDSLLFLSFLLSPQGQSILKAHGLSSP
jgi:molybdate transport system substrate-binding protein